MDDGNNYFFKSVIKDQKNKNHVILFDNPLKIDKEFLFKIKKKINSKRLLEIFQDKNNPKILAEIYFNSEKFIIKKEHFVKIFVSLGDQNMKEYKNQFSYCVSKSFKMNMKIYDFLIKFESLEIIENRKKNKIFNYDLSKKLFQYASLSSKKYIEMFSKKNKKKNPFKIVSESSLEKNSNLKEDIIFPENTYLKKYRNAKNEKRIKSVVSKENEVENFSNKINNSENFNSKKIENLSENNKTLDHKKSERSSLSFNSKKSKKLIKKTKKITPNSKSEKSFDSFDEIIFPKRSRKINPLKIQPDLNQISKKIKKNIRLKKIKNETEELSKKSKQEENSKICPICICETNIINAKINSCGHIFCFDCLFEWSKITNKCPLCKSEFNYIKKMSGKNFLQKIKIKKKEQIIEEEEIDEELANAENFCYKCREETHANFLLVCDNCVLKCCHTFCLEPPLEFIPDNDWFCDFCVVNLEIVTNNPIANINLPNSNRRRERERRRIERERRKREQEILEREKAEKDRLKREKRVRKRSIQKKQGVNILKRNLRRTNNRRNNNERYFIDDDKLKGIEDNSEFDYLPISDNEKKQLDELAREMDEINKITKKKDKDLEKNLEDFLKDFDEEKKKKKI